MKIQKFFNLIALVSLAAAALMAQTETPPAPSAPRSMKIPAVAEKKLANGLTVASVERKNVPLVTVQLVIKSGASEEKLPTAGLANLTAAMLTKGTKTRSATQIAEQVEFLGGSINTGAGWNTSVVTISVMSDKLDQAMTLLADVVLNPKFDENELKTLKSQTLDGLTYNLQQPGFLANYVASRYSFNEHPPGGTPDSLAAITRENIVKFKGDHYLPDNAVLIFTGDIAAVRANALAQKYFGTWRPPAGFKRPPPNIDLYGPAAVAGDQPLVRRILVVDLPDSGQASVNYATPVLDGRAIYNDKDKTTSNPNFYIASVLNSVLGGGYSSRLNQEIRIKRGLSYGAGSVFGWRERLTNFSTRTQTKNDSAAEVAELVMGEIKRLTDTSVPAAELAPRKLVLTGDFGRDLETTGGIAQHLADLYSFGLPATELASFMKNVNNVTDSQIKEYASENLKSGDLIIVGDYKIFKDDLAKRFPGRQIDVIKAENLDLSKENLHK